MDKDSVRLTIVLAGVIVVIVILLVGLYKKRAAIKNNVEKNMIDIDDDIGVQLDLIQDSVESEGSALEVDASESNSKAKKNELLVFDVKRRVFLVKKKITTVGLFFPESRQAIIKLDNEREKTIAVDPALSKRTLPMSGIWQGDNQYHIGFYDPEAKKFLLLTDKHQFIHQINDKHDAALLPLIGDWAGTGVDNVGVYSPQKGTFYLRKNHDMDSLDADRNKEITYITFLSAHDRMLPIVGNWNGDGKTKVGLYDPATQDFYWHWELKNEPVLNKLSSFGYPSDKTVPLVGDWYGEGKHRVGLYYKNNGLFYLAGKNDESPTIFHFGPVNDRLIPLIGDWNGDGIDTIGLYDPDLSLFYLSDINASENANQIIHIEKPENEKIAIPFTSVDFK